MGDRRGRIRRRTRGQGARDLEVQPRRRVADDPGEERGRRRRSGHLPPAVGHPGGSQRRHFRRGRPWRRREQPHCEVLERRDLHQGLGKHGSRERRVQRPSRPGDGFPGTVVRRRPGEQSYPDLRPGREPHRYLDAVRPAKRTFHRRERHPLRGRLGVERQATSRLEAGHLHRERQGRLGNGLHSGPRAGPGRLRYKWSRRRCGG